MGNYSKEKIRLVKELHAPARRRFPRRQVLVRGVDDLWQMDLAVMIQHAKYNKNYKYILVVIDAFSKYVWAERLKTKTGSDVTEAFSRVLDKAGRMPTNLQADRGREFYNKGFLDLVRARSINFYSTYSNLKASISERVIRTLKAKIYQLCSLRGKYTWIDTLQDVIEEYNNTKHRTIGMKPVQVWERSKNQDKIVSKLLSTVHSRRSLPHRYRYKVGDAVRISRYKAVFDKSYTANWGTEVFTIYRVQDTNPPTYLLRDIRGEKIAGAFYEPELSHVADPSVYLVEKILKRRGNQVLVK